MLISAIAHCQQRWAVALNERCSGNAVEFALEPRYGSETGRWFRAPQAKEALGEAPKGAHTLSRDSAPDSGCLLSTYLRNVLIIGPELGYYSHRVGYGAPVAIGRQLPASIV